MSGLELAVIVGAAALGWWIVSRIFDARSSGSTSSQTDTPEPDTTQIGDSLNLDDLGKQWFVILNVSPDADLAEIDRAYADALAGCQRQDQAATTQEQKLAMLHRRNRIEAAYDFIRTARKSAGRASARSGPGRM